MTDQPDDDILSRLDAAAADHTIPAELAAMLCEAADIIRTLRLLVGIRQEIELEDIEPEGRA